jgi:hypothetical protein
MFLFGGVKNNAPGSVKTCWQQPHTAGIRDGLRFGGFGL